jgi:hypothetical protein
MYPERPVPNRRSNTPTISFRGCAAVKAGAHFSIFISMRIDMSRASSLVPSSSVRSIDK